ncbi:MAG: hypothetical protein HC919_05165 [Oscillatoriales cyanobacterium SM2_2_1]|nr:hypothetical protein [Oscillatoriales cyanobacterium SM2_2_1]
MVSLPLTCPLTAYTHPKCPLGSRQLGPALSTLRTLRQEAAAVTDPNFDSPDGRWRDRMMPKSFARVTA